MKSSFLIPINFSGLVLNPKNTSNDTKISLHSKGAVPSKRSGGQRQNGGFCKTQVDCMNPAYDCVPLPSGGEWG